MRGVRSGCDVARIPFIQTLSGATQIFSRDPAIRHFRKNSRTATGEMTVKISGPEAAH